MADVIDVKATQNEHVDRWYSINQIKMEIVYLTCDHKLAGNQFSLPHVLNKWIMKKPLSSSF